MIVKLSDILGSLPDYKSSDLKKYNDILVSGIELDSRKVSEGNLFIAYKGYSMDGRSYMLDAINAGATTVLYDDTDGYDINKEIITQSSLNKAVILPVAKIQDYISIISSVFYNNPSDLQNVYAFTGTNGKTTCTYLLSQILAKISNKKVGVIGTIGYGEINEIINNNSFKKLDNTTPNPILTQKILAEFKSQNIDYVTLEASSHALDQSRLNGINISTAVFTNLTNDHLDYHLGLNDYYKAKRKLFLSHNAKNIIINIDDDYGKKLLDDVSSRQFKDAYYKSKEPKKVLYGFDKIYLESTEMSYITYNDGCLILYDSGEIIKLTLETNLIGKFNISNLMAVIAALYANGYSFKYLVSSCHDIMSAPGRMEIFSHSKKNIKIIVDYAHTPDALQKTLMAISEYYTDNTVWCVFGCGGDRDKTKRPLMGSIAAEYSDKLIITDDNPRTEPPANITQEIRQGISSKYCSKIIAIINDRKKAIKHALDNADYNDIILIAGKGHEDYQICGNEVVDYNERLFVRELIKQ